MTVLLGVEDPARVRDLRRMKALCQPARQVELFAGRDLQCSRINGTVVGALAGVVIHVPALALGT